MYYKYFYILYFLIKKKQTNEHNLIKYKKLKIVKYKNYYSLYNM